MKRRRKSSDGDCQLCGRPLDLERLAGVQGRMAPGEDVSESAGGTVTLDISGFPIVAVVPNPDSPARAQGIDVIMLVCSHDCASAIRIAAAIDADEEGRLFNPGDEILGGLRRRSDADATTDRTFQRMERFETVLYEAAPELARRLGFEAPAPRTAAGRDGDARAAADELLGSTCAWCLREIPDDAPVQALRVWLVDNSARPELGTFISLKIGGRTVPGRLAEPGSPAAAECDMAFMLCGKSCAAQLRAAIDEDLSLRIVH
jgi:hypothetical protein